MWQAATSSSEDDSWLLALHLNSVWCVDVHHVLRRRGQQAGKQYAASVLFHKLELLMNRLSTTHLLLLTVKRCIKMFHSTPRFGTHVLCAGIRSSSWKQFHRRKLMRGPQLPVPAGDHHTWRRPRRLRSSSLPSQQHLQRPGSCFQPACNIAVRWGPDAQDLQACPSAAAECLEVCRSPRSRKCIRRLA